LEASKNKVATALFNEVTGYCCQGLALQNGCLAERRIGKKNEAEFLLEISATVNI